MYRISKKKTKKRKEYTKKVDNLEDLIKEIDDLFLISDQISKKVLKEIINKNKKILETPLSFEKVKKYKEKLETDSKNKNIKIEKITNLNIKIDNNFFNNFEIDFDFTTQKKLALIYAKNGTMKSTFANVIKEGSQEEVKIKHNKEIIDKSNFFVFDEDIKTQKNLKDFFLGHEYFERLEDEKRNTRKKAEILKKKIVSLPNLQKNIVLIEAIKQLDISLIIEIMENREYYYEENPNKKELEKLSFLLNKEIENEINNNTDKKLVRYVLKSKENKIPELKYFFENEIYLNKRKIDNNVFLDINLFIKIKKNVISKILSLIKKDSEEIINLKYAIIEKENIENKKDDFLEKNNFPEVKWMVNNLQYYFDLTFDLKMNEQGVILKNNNEYIDFEKISKAEKTILVFLKNLIILNKRHTENKKNEEKRMFVIIDDLIESFDIDNINGFIEYLYLFLENKGNLFIIYLTHSLDLKKQIIDKFDKKVLRKTVRKTKNNLEIKTEPVVASYNTIFTNIEQIIKEKSFKENEKK